MGRPQKLSEELKDRVRGMFGRGESCRTIADALQAEGIQIHFTTVSRIVSPPAGAAPRVHREPPTEYGVRGRKKPSPQPPSAPPEPVPIEAVNSASEATHIPDKPIDINEDPRILAREDWLYYERLKIKLRQLADTELAKNNMRGHRDLLNGAQAAEKRAAELRPPIPPDPHSDPAYLGASRKLTDYISELVRRAEQGQPIPERTSPPMEPHAA
jgi:hypothetical protein